ncbi:MAG: peptidoglycan DD-metalloendopeptidase family protein [Synergistetes bacterium]|nr:peptidoglycan DD-metalloendopeptidase family protein [Synergistota bacterium]
MSKKWFSFLLFILLLLPSVSFAINYDAEIEKRQKLLERIKKQLRYQEKLIKYKARKEKSILAQINRLDKEIERKRLEIKITDFKIRKLKSEIDKKRKLIARLLRELEEKRALLSSRIKAMYRYGRIGYLEALLKASSWEDLALRGLYLKRIASYEASLIDEIRRKEMKVSKEKALLERKLKRFFALKRTLQKEMAELGRKKLRRQALLKKIQKEKKLYQRARAEFEELSRKLELAIRKLILEKKMASSRRVVSGGSFRLGYRRVRLVWPVRGRITSGFGYRIHPIFKTKRFHAGIDIAAPTGTAVKAAASGEVLYAGWLRGYGKVIIILHRGGMATVYAHLRDIVVREGQRVAQGEIIGSVGSTGWSTGPHLYFEVRIDGRAVNPLKYLPR